MNVTLNTLTLEHGKALNGLKMRERGLSRLTWSMATKNHVLEKTLTAPSPPQLMTHLPSGLQTTLQTPSPLMMR